MRLSRLASLIILVALGCSKKPLATVTRGELIDTLNPVQVTTRGTLPTVLKESSGLCYTDGNLWTFGDSGNPNAIYKIDSTTGSILQTVIIQNFPNDDWEDITADSAYLYIGDFGNNYGNRTNLKIIRIQKSDLKSASPVLSILGDSIGFRYQDQTDFSTNTNTNFDCESVIAMDNSLYLFTKDGGDLKTRCYKLPKQPGSYQLSPLSTFDCQGKITAAAYNSQFNEITLLGYMNKKVESFIWVLKDFPNDDFFSGYTHRFNFGSEKVWQTEGINYRTQHELFLTCESAGTQPASLYVLNKP